MPRISGLLLPTLIRFRGKTGTPTQGKKTSISGWCFSSSPVASFGTVTFSTSTGPVPGPEEHGHVGRWDLFQYLLRGSSTNGSPILSTYEDCKSDDPPHPHHVSKNRGVEGPATPSFCTGRPVGRGRTEEGGGGGGGGGCQKCLSAKCCTSRFRLNVLFSRLILSPPPPTR